ncbi:MAG: hypothetical protein NT075_08235 [Chloroflexi bacterium]|nr:hypothetical protein [Chloroflexota bacterium]
MTNFLFWNLHGNPIHEIISRLAHQHQIDVIILAECRISPATLLKALNPLGSADYFYAPIFGCEKLEFYTRFSSGYLLPIEESARMSIRHLNLPGIIDTLVAAIHFNDKRNWSDDSQMMAIGNFARTINDVEDRIGHKRTILVGDFNMNPFETGMVSTMGLHATMDRRIAQRVERTVQKETYTYFYNPMWSLLGDASPGAPGTYYYNNSEPRTYFWNMFDQVLIRPELLDRFNNTSLKIIDQTGDVKFLNEKGQPNSAISDHLPILFKLEL